MHRNMNVKNIYLYQTLHTHLHLNTYYFVRRTSGRSLGTLKLGSILLEIGGALGRELSSGATRQVRCTSVSQKGEGSRVTMTWQAGARGGGLSIAGWYDIPEVSRIDWSRVSCKWITQNLQTISSRHCRWIRQVTGVSHAGSKTTAQL
jgi:hypothetical protein